MKQNVKILQNKWTDAAAIKGKKNENQNLAIASKTKTP